jgi:hypothetical protein
MVKSLRYSLNAEQRRMLAVIRANASPKIS